ncbi:MAG TPA: hypothetical protein VGI46_12995 [Candidatus Acidoferrum sp.]
MRVVFGAGLVEGKDNAQARGGQIVSRPEPLGVDADAESAEVGKGKDGIAGVMKCVAGCGGIVVTSLLLRQ